MFVFDVSTRSREVRALEKEGKLAKRPTKKIEDRIRGEKMANVRLNKVRNILLASAIVGSSIIPTRAFAVVSSHDKDRLDARSAGLAVATPIKSKYTIKPIFGSDNFEVTRDSKPFPWRASEALKQFGLDKFPEGCQQLSVGGENSGQSVIVLPDGLIYIRSISDIDDGVKLDLGVLKSNERIDKMKIVTCDSNGVRPILNLCDGGAELLVVDGTKKKSYSYDLTKQFRGLKVGNVGIYVNIDNPNDRKIFISNKDGKEETLICGMAIDTNTLLLADR